MILSEILTYAEVSRTLRFASAWGSPTRLGVAHLIVHQLCVSVRVLFGTRGSISLLRMERQPPSENVTVRILRLALVIRTPSIKYKDKASKSETSRKTMNNQLII